MSNYIPQTPWYMILHYLHMPLCSTAVTNKIHFNMITHTYTHTHTHTYIYIYAQLLLWHCWLRPHTTTRFYFAFFSSQLPSNVAFSICISCAFLSSISWLNITSTEFHKASQIISQAFVLVMARWHPTNVDSDPWRPIILLGSLWVKKPTMVIYILCQYLAKATESYPTDT